MSIGEHRHCCVTFEDHKDLYGKKPIVSVTYENEKNFNKKQLTVHKMCYVSPVWSMGRFMAVLWVIL